MGNTTLKVVTIPRAMRRGSPCFLVRLKRLFPRSGLTPQEGRSSPRHHAGWQPRRCPILYSRCDSDGKTVLEHFHPHWNREVFPTSVTHDSLAFCSMGGGRHALAAWQTLCAGSAGTRFRVSR